MVISKLWLLMVVIIVVIMGRNVTVLYNVIVVVFNGY